MANERYGLRCPKCSDTLYIGKTMGVWIYINGTEDRMSVVYLWMEEHLRMCWGGMEFGCAPLVLFEVVPAVQPDVQKGIGTEKHWNRFTEEAGRLVIRDWGNKSK